MPDLSRTLRKVSHGRVDLNDKHENQFQNLGPTGHPSSVNLGQLEYDVDQSGVVGWLAIAFGGFETNLLCGMHGGFVQTVAQALHDAHDAKLA